MKFLIELEEKEQQWIGCVKRMDRTRILRRIELNCTGNGYRLWPRPRWFQASRKHQSTKKRAGI